MLDWNTGRFQINAGQLATPTDRMLVCGVKKHRVGRGSTPVVEAPLAEPLADLLEGPTVMRRPVYRARPTATIATLAFTLGGVLGFFAVATWPF